MESILFEIAKSHIKKIESEKEYSKIIDCLKPHKCSAYIIKTREIEDYDLNKKYEKEIDSYTRNFISINKCNQWDNVYCEYPEYWEGLNQIRKKYGLNKIKQNECKGE